MDITQLNKKYAELISKAEAESKKAVDGVLSQEQIATVNTLLGQADELKVQIDLQNRVAQGAAYAAEGTGTKAAFHGWRESGPQEGEEKIDVKAFREEKFDTPWGPRTVRFNIPLAVQSKDYAPAFESYLRKGIYEMGPQDRKTLQVGVDSAGGFLVPEDYHVELIKKIATMATVRNFARVITTSRDSAKWPRVSYATDDLYTSPVRLTWTGEIPTSATVHRVTEPTFGELNIPVHTAMASMPVSNDMIEDAAFDILGIGSEMLAEAFALGENAAFWTGTGSNQPLGILTQAGTSTDNTLYAQVVRTGDTDNVSGNGLIDIVYSMPAQYRPSSRFFMASTTAKQIRQLVSATSGDYLWPIIPSAGNLGPVNESLLGYPVTYDEMMPAFVTDASAYFLAFGDLRGYIVVDRVGFSLQRLSELYAETNITLLLARKRVGGFLAEPWRVLVQTETA